MSSYQHMSDEALWDALPGATLSERAEILQAIGLRYIHREQWHSAISVLEQAKDAYERLGCSADVRVCGNWIARCMSRAGDCDAAIAGHKQVLASLQEHDPTNSWVGMTLDAIGCDYRDQGKHQTSIEWFASAARQHEANGDKRLAVNSARKWMTAITKTGTWQEMTLATAIVLRNSDEITDHIHAHVGNVRAAAAGMTPEVDMTELLAKCDRLRSTTDDVECSLEVELAHVAALCARGDFDAAGARALQGRTTAKEFNAPDHQAEFLMQAAQCFTTSMPERAEHLLLVAQDLAEVLGDNDLQDRARTSLMHVRELTRAAEEDSSKCDQPSLW